MFFYLNNTATKNITATKKTMRYTLYVLFSGFLVTASQSVWSQVQTCEALTLYGNAVNERLCKKLSPGTQNLWVCALTDGATDIHTTFNANTNLHVTVREHPAPPGCEGNSQLSGNWPGALAIAAGQPAAVCGVNIQNYVDRLNAVQQLPAGNTTACRAAFLAAGGNGRITPALMQSYLNLCDANQCP